VRVTDAPPEYDIESIDVTFSKVKVHKAGDDGEDGVWITIEIIDGELELLELQEEDLEALLATGDGVPAGKYTQLRVIIDAVAVTLVEGEPPEVILPSGELKFVRPFEVFDGETTILLLDFDADKSLTVTGDGKIIVKPVVKLSVSEKGKPNKLEYSLETSGDATAEQSDEQAYSGEESVHLLTAGDVGDGDEARIVIPLPDGTTLGDIDSISWWEYLVEGYIPHVDLELDLDADSNSENDKLVAEAAHQNDNNTTTWDTSYRGGDVGWIQTFEGASGVYTSWANWLTGSPSPVTSVNDTTAMWMFAADDATYRLDTLANFKSGIGDVDASTVVLAIEVEIDNWVLQSEAYVDDIEIVIGGVTYTVGL